MKWTSIIITAILLLLVKRCDSATTTTISTTTTTTPTTKSPEVTTTVQPKPVENKESVANTGPPSNNEAGESNPVVTTQPPLQKPPETTTTQVPVVTKQSVKTTQTEQEQHPEKTVEKTTTAGTGNQNLDQTVLTTKPSGSDKTNVTNNNNLTSGESVQANTTPNLEEIITPNTTLDAEKGNLGPAVVNETTAHNTTPAIGPENQDPIAVNGTSPVAQNITPAGGASNLEPISVNGTTPVQKMTPTPTAEINSALLNATSAVDGAVQTIRNKTVSVNESNTLGSSQVDSASENESSTETYVMITPGVQITTPPTELNNNTSQPDQTTLPQADLNELDFDFDATTPVLKEPTTNNFTNEEETEEEIIDELIEDIFGLDTNFTTGPPTNVSQDLDSNTTATSFFTDGSTYPVILITSLCFGIIFFLVVIILVIRRVYDGWQKRHYSRIDYLVNGMYN